ncbi:MAG: glutathione S-transferase family protein [Xanthobacteraceae bacterium]
MARKSKSKARAVKAAKKAKPAAKAKSAARKLAAPKKSVSSGRSKPIDLYYWSTPNGWKITIMLEECGLPYNVIPVNISAGEQFKPEFLKISPNNRMPVIVDPQGPGGKPISVFESGAILQYLGRKTGKFYPADERGRVEVDQWLFWQMGGLGPMAGQANHFRHYAPEQIEYAVKRYTDEVNRLFGVMNKRLAGRDFLAGKYSIADMACIGWTNPWERLGQNIEDFPHLKRWREAIYARPASKRGLDVRVANAPQVSMQDPKVRAILFNQRARG